MSLSSPLLALAAALLLAGCEANTAPAPTAERPVQVQRVAFADADSKREFVGVVRARYETDLGFRVAGKIVSRLINNGDVVHAGDVIARLDPQDFVLQVESAEAELAAATSNLAQARAEAERYATLKTRGFAAVADFDRKNAARDEAEGRLERARRTLACDLRASPSQLSGRATTASFSPCRASRATDCPIATTWPASAGVAVMTPSASALSSA